MINKNDIIELQEDLSSSPLYSKDLAPVPKNKRTWSKWGLAAIWVGMAVCIPTYMLASSIILEGISWVGALVVIALANVIITIPMVLSGHAGVKYGIPFPVLGRSSFGHNGIHIPAIIRGIIAAIWFGIQTWIGGISIYSIYCALTGQPANLELSIGLFISFLVFWCVNVYFIIKGTESIKALELFAAPILILMGVALIAWGSIEAGGFTEVLKQSEQLKKPSVILQNNDGDFLLTIDPIKDKNGQIKAESYQIEYPVSNEKKATTNWLALSKSDNKIHINEFPNIDIEQLTSGENNITVQLKKGEILSQKVTVSPQNKSNSKSTLWSYLVMLTAMVGFWATMSISIADITRYSKSQSDQIKGQFIGLPGTMTLYSFVGIFVTCAALVIFGDVLIRADAPWDPAALLAKFDNPIVVIIAQVFMLIATLSTNIAANVIAPANAFSNAFPKKINFKMGGIITAIIGILICPWWIINHIIPMLLFISSLLGPVVAILICDYFVLRKTKLNLVGLYKTDSEYSFGGSGYNKAAIIAFVVGAFFAGIGYFVKNLSFLYDISWFVGFIISFGLYYVLMKKNN